MTDFENWLCKGLGRAVIFLKSTDARLWREQLLYACTHNLAYDRQCEGSRSAWLLELIGVSCDEEFYRDRLIECLQQEGEDLDLGQIFELSASFASRGSAASREAMYRAFERIGFLEAGMDCASQLVILDGVDGLAFVMGSFGELPDDERPWQFGRLIEELKQHHGDYQLPAELDTFAQEWQKYARADALEREKDPEPPPTYEEIRNRIVAKGRHAGTAYWSRKASAEDMERLAADVCAETNPDRLYGFLRMFQMRTFPGPLNRLIELAGSDDEGIARVAMNALKLLSDPAIRGIALEAAKNPELGGLAVEMLIRNRHDDDYGFIEQLLRNADDEDDFHALTLAAREFMKEHPDVRAERSLLLLYERNPCALCRRGVVEALIAIDRLPPWLAEECRYDSYDETRKLLAGNVN